MRSRLFLAFLLSIIASFSHAFKEEEFKKCADIGFCRRHRDKSGPVFEVMAQSVKVSEGDRLMRATIRAKTAAAVDLSFQLHSYADGFLRLTIDEASSDLGARYRIKDIIQTEAINERDSFEVKGTFKIMKKDATQIVLKAADTTVSIFYLPFKIAIQVKDKPAMNFNAKGLFDFEHRRVKDDATAHECDGCWDETFRGFKDTKPKGPEAISLDISFPGSEHVYGIPEHATNFALKPTLHHGEPYRMYNLDVFEYLDSSPFGLYGAIPMMMAHKSGLTSGVFWLNAAEMYIDVSKSGDTTNTQWIAESGIVDLFFFPGPRPAEVMRQYASLTGPTALPQLFAIGYHQCRWNYRDEADTYSVDEGFDEHVIPYDVIWLDIEHTNGKRYLTWDSNHFPHPIELQDNIASRKRKVVTIVDPHVKRDHSYYIFKEAEAARSFVKNSDGAGDFDGWCWPGQSSYLDVTSPAVREWWSQQFTLDKYEGSTQHLYIWNDMNEPSVFNGPEVTMQKDLIHHGGVEHRDVHNLYGLYYHQGTADGLKLRGKLSKGGDGDRPFVLSRAFFAGTQGIGPIWTGDNTADWKHLKVSVPMLLSLGVAGLTFSGADVGGFFGNPDAELLTRWYQVGAFYPFFRGHAHLETQRREPWLFGEDATRRIRGAIRERYALLPYIYTQFRLANTTGIPILRPLWFEFPEAKVTFKEEEEFMVGPAILVRPVLQPGASHVDALLPRNGRWFCAYSGQEVENKTESWLPGVNARASQTHRRTVDMEGIPVFYRGGNVVARRERPRRSSGAQSEDPYTLVVVLDKESKAAGDLYIDDGESFSFQRGHYAHRDFVFDGTKLKNVVRMSSACSTSYCPGGMTQMADPRWKGAEGLEIERVVFLGLPKASKGSEYSAKLPGGKVVPLEVGPLSLAKAPDSTQGLVLRRPGLKVTDAWEVELIVA